MQFVKVICFCFDITSCFLKIWHILQYDLYIKMNLNINKLSYLLTGLETNREKPGNFILSYMQGYSPVLHCAYFHI